MSDSAGMEMSPDAIAIIGMSGRFPGARDLSEFWNNLSIGVESISFFTDQQLMDAGVDPSVRQDPSFVGAGGVLKDIDLFDASFFGFNPREAEAMDPQQRLFLECAWETMENAGYDSSRFPDSIGVYAGTGFSTYLFNVLQTAELVNLLGGHQVMIGNDKDHLTTHVSYKLNLRGPSLAVQTACSTSLVAVCLACRSLLDYQCDMAFAGGSSIAVPQGRGYWYREGGIASPDGHCRAFDAKARGTVAGNGVGCVLLKRYGDAVSDRDYIRAVIRGTALNNDGAVKVGYTAPSVDGQAEVIAMAHAVAGVKPESITFVEAHGTGTPLGDPIEIAALAQAFNGVAGRNRCVVGSVKSNIGHLDTAAGIAGLVKVVLAIENHLIPPTLHFANPNPRLDIERTPFYINARAVDWNPGIPRRAGVSSFGIGGTNAHVVLEEVPTRTPSGPGRPAQLLVLSAQTSAALDALAGRYGDFFRSSSTPAMADVAYTASIGRKPLKHRLAIVCRDPQEAAILLDQELKAQAVRSVTESGHRPVVFLFPGQGAQYPNMSAGLYRDEPVFREALDACIHLLQERSGVALRGALFPAADTGDDADARLADTSIAQPALFAVEYALARMFMAWGVSPEQMIGHSIGEYVAACLAGVFSLENALRLVALRGHLMQSMPRGAMLAVSADANVINPLLDEELSLAAINTPSQCVVSGPAGAITSIEAKLARSSIGCVRLNTSHAFHSAMMDPILPAFRDAVAAARPQPPSIPIVSNVTGRRLSDAEAVSPQYWATHLRNCVRFAEGLEKIVQQPGSVLLEIGPGQTLAGLAHRHPAKALDTLIVSSMRRASQPQEDYPYLLRSVGRLWVSGVEPDWKRFYARECRNRVPLPTYPFERKRYWVNPPVAHEKPESKRGLKSADRSDWFYGTGWRSTDLPERAETDETRTWLIFNEGAIGDALEAELRRRNQKIVVVQQGERFNSLSDDHYVARPESEADYAAVIRSLQRNGRLPDEILHCWSVPPGGNSVQAIDRGFHSLLYLARALEKCTPRPRLRINMISTGVQAVLGDDFIEPEKSTLLGPCTVIPQERPGIRCRSIDITNDASPPVLSAIVDECIPSTKDPVVAYRGGRRWVRYYEPLRWPEEKKQGSLLRPNGVYVITGGFGNIGLTLAETLARNFGARLALLSRTQLPLPDAWDKWLAAHDTEEPISRRIRAIRELETLGAKVLAIPCDVRQPEQLESALQRVQSAMTRIDGIIHAAAEMSSRAFQPVTSTDRINAELHFGAKFVATKTLARLVPQFNPDFCMLVSSISSMLGGLNFSAYAAANCFLDTFAERQNHCRPHTRWISVNWDGWRFDPDGRKPSELSLTPAEGAEVFRRIMEHRNATRVIVSTGDLTARLDRWVRFGVQEEPEPDAGDQLNSGYDRPQLNVAYAKPKTTMEQLVADVWQLILGIKDVGIHDNFFELGGHSLLAIQLVSRLRDLLQADLGLTVLFEYPTVHQLAKHIDATIEDVDERMQGLAEMLDLVEGLSPEEVKALLATEQEG